MTEDKGHSAVIDDASGWSTFEGWAIDKGEVLYLDGTIVVIETRVDAGEPAAPS